MRYISKKFIYLKKDEKSDVKNDAILYALMGKPIKFLSELTAKGLIDY